MGRFSGIVCFLAIGLLTGSATAGMESSVFDTEQQKVKYGLVYESGGDIAAYDAGDATYSETDMAGIPGRKSSAKAFLMSLVVPGAGQLYAGNKIRPVIFLGVEAAAWGLHASYHSKGEDATDIYEAFNQEHWSRDRHQDYMDWTYGEMPDTFTEITHHLPETNTQQFYEMTGKYDQFAWGWDDASLRDSMMYTEYKNINPPPRVFYAENVPVSPNRDKYEGLRDDANSEYNKATKMLTLVLANHVISAFEAFIQVHRHNKALEQSGGEETFLSRVRVKPSLRSVYTDRDTPYVKVTYKF